LGLNRTKSDEKSERRKLSTAKLPVNAVLAAIVPCAFWAGISPYHVEDAKYAMTEHFEREVAAFNAARQLSASERASYLDQACAGDASLRKRVEELLRAGVEAGGFLEDAPPGAERLDRASAAPGRNAAAAPGENVGDHIGRYKLLQQIGEGGCGLVYMAEQEEPVRRRVALKVIKLGMDTKQVIARFEAERQALALMDHPNIARVLDAGATDTGRPYFVMELVRGIKITHYCDEQNLATKARLDLFIQVCHAVQHAHQKGIIHRDLKPSNILVASDDGIPVPKIIDFGIAKATQGRLTDQTLFTAFEQFIGTPAYMSPEQAQLTMQDVDTRTDIYSLGVLLYELLTGKTPFDQKELLAAGLDVMRQTIREKEPVRPSTRLGTLMKAELTTTAKHRHTDAPKLVHDLRGDLDWIVMKCLEKDRARRFQTANGLAMDVQRHMADEPVVARPPSKLYRFQKLARRNKLAFTAAGGVVAALVIGLAAATWEYFKERKALQRAVAVSGLLQQILSAADPDGLKGSAYTVRELLDDFAAGLTNQLAGQPEAEATVRLTIGRTYAKLGVFSGAEPNLRRALDLRQRALGMDHPQTLEAQEALTHFLSGAERRWEEATALSQQTWNARRRLLGPEHRDTLSSQQEYAFAMTQGGRAREAEPIQRQVLEIRRRVLPPDDYDTIDAVGTLAQVLMFCGSVPEAERYFRECLAGFQRIGYSNKVDGITCVKEIAVARLQQGDPAGARNLLEEVLPRSRKFLGPDALMTLHIQRVLARALAEEGRPDEAEKLCKETLSARLGSRVGEEGYGNARTRLTLGRVLVENGKLDEAEPVLTEALKFFREDPVCKPLPYLAAQAANWLGAIALARKSWSQAEALLLPDSSQFFSPVADISPNERRLGVSHIVQLYQATDKPDQVAEWKQRLADYNETQR
jgi:serine/threonine protein kinase/tetratricopeptide (TPR) repeat protein